MTAPSNRDSEYDPHILWCRTAIPKEPVYIPQSTTEPLRYLSPPINGWVALFIKLQELGIYELPGEHNDSIRNKPLVHDGIIAVIELSTSDGYRIYKYSNIGYDTTSEVEKIEQLIDLVLMEFDTNLY